MRAGFGIVAFLIAFGLMIYLWSSSVSTVSKQAVPAQNQARQFAGQDENGRRAIDSVKLSVQDRDGKFQHVLVDSIDANGAMAKHFGLQKGDEILAVGPMDLRDSTFSGMALELIQESYQRQQELKVRRGDEVITLPQPKSPGQPAVGADNTPPELRAIKNIQRIPTH